MSAPDVRVDEYTPWQEPAASRDARHVGRDPERDAIVAWLDRIVPDGAPMPMWLVGPRGIGKSHLIAWARDEAIRRGLPVRLLPEDLPVANTVAGLLDPADVPWASWDEAAKEEPRVLLIEGLDRHLAAMSTAEQGALRIRVRESKVGLLATGVTVPSAIVDRDAPFYGGFDVWRLSPLDVAEAEMLHERVAGPPTDADGLARRRALVRLAGGNARALVALAQASTRHDSVEDILEEVLSSHVPHYQDRFRDLSPEGQRIVSRMAAAPRFLRPRDLTDLSNASVPLRALVDDGVAHRIPGGAAWYELREPLFRYWLEYRQAERWDSTRAASLARLLGNTLTRRELAQVWWSTRGELRTFLDRDRRVVDGLLDMDDAFRLKDYIQGDAERAAAILLRWFSRGREGGPDWLAPDFLPPTSQAVARFLRDLEIDRAGAVRTLVDTLYRLRPGSEANALAELVVSALARSEPRGTPQVLSVEHRRKLARIPGLRARFAVQGRLPGHAPFLRVDDLMNAGIGPEATDLPALLSAAHQLGSAELFGLVARWPTARLPGCPRPERPAPTRAGLLDLLLRSGPAIRWSWAASAALLDDVEWRLFLDAPHPATDTDTAGLLTPLLALGTRKPARLADLAEVAAFTPLVRSAVPRLLQQLDARADGPLQAELAMVWAALDPDAVDEPPPVP